MTRPVDPSEILQEVRDGAAYVTLNRPPLNILDPPLLRLLAETLQSLDARDDWRVLVLRGLPKAFSAGVAVEDHMPERIESTLAAFRGALEALEGSDRPTVAVIRGHCLGGGMEFAMACDFAVAAEGAMFGQPEIKLAAIPPFAVARYAGLVGPRRAFADLATGRIFPAREAAKAGYLNACLPDAELDPWVAHTVAELASLSRVALAVLKRAFRERRTGDTKSVERDYLERLARTPDAVEGLRAFLEKRAPRWEARP
ncbi:MAG: enoyl-CoA hydratase/isomerase family protein [Euryarchaeota archaeon]|nr:enoyl-CoA hydratase/isomerase family protein [Euryarchaeota archaeon]